MNPLDSWLCLVASGLVISVAVYLLLRWSLKHLLDDVVRLVSARKFYLRVLLVTLVFGALAATVGVTIAQEKDKPFMDAVWQVAQSLDSAFWSLLVILMVYVVLVTILIAALGRRREQ